MDQVIFGGLLSEPPQVTDSFTGDDEIGQHFDLILWHIVLRFCFLCMRTNLENLLIESIKSTGFWHFHPKV